MRVVTNDGGFFRALVDKGGGFNLKRILWIQVICYLISFSNSCSTITKSSRDLEHEKMSNVFYHLIFKAYSEGKYEQIIPFAEEAYRDAVEYFGKEHKIRVCPTSPIQFML